MPRKSVDREAAEAFLEQVRDSPDLSLGALRARNAVGESVWRRWKQFPWFAEAIATSHPQPAELQGEAVRNKVAKAKAIKISPKSPAFRKFCKVFAATSNWAAAERESGLASRIVMRSISKDSIHFDENVYGYWCEHAESALVAKTETAVYQLAEEGDMRALALVLESRAPKRWDRSGRHALAEQRQRDAGLVSAELAGAVTAGLLSVIEAINARGNKPEPVQVEAIDVTPRAVARR